MQDNQHITVGSVLSLGAFWLSKFGHVFASWWPAGLEADVVGTYLQMVGTTLGGIGTFIFALLALNAKWEAMQAARRAARRARREAGAGA